MRWRRRESTHCGHSRRLSGTVALRPIFAFRLQLSSAGKRTFSYNMAWDKPVIHARLAKCRLPTRADNRAFGHLGSLNEQGWLFMLWRVSGAPGWLADIRSLGRSVRHHDDRCLCWTLMQ